MKALCDKFSHTRFEPSGWSGNPKIGYAKSLMDYLFRWLELRFLKGEQGILFELFLDVHARKITVERNDRFEDYATTAYEV